MKLGTAKFYNKLGNKDKTKNVKCRIEEPSIQAKSWYQMNTNRNLTKIIIVHGNAEDYEEFDSIMINSSKTYYIIGYSVVGTRRVRLEVGS